MFMVVIHDAMTPEQYQHRQSVLLKSRSLLKGANWFFEHRMPMPAEAYFHVVEGVTPTNWTILDNVCVVIADLPVQ
jgi:hypothetical protein